MNTLEDFLLEPAGERDVVRPETNRVVGHVARQKPCVPWASERLAPIQRTGRGHDGGKTSTGQSGVDVVVDYVSTAKTLTDGIKALGTGGRLATGQCWCVMGAHLDHIMMWVLASEGSR